MFIADLIKQIVDRIDEEKKDDIDECDTCGQFSRLKGGLCDWCQRTYERDE
jgi:hypothetical protein